MIHVKEYIKDFMDSSQEEAIEYEKQVNEAVLEVIRADESDIPLASAIKDETAFPKLYYFHNNITIPTSVLTTDLFQVGWELDLDENMKEFFRALSLEGTAESSSMEWRAFLRLSLFTICFCAEVGERYDTGDDGTNILEDTESRTDALLIMARLQREKAPPTRPLTEILTLMINYAKITELATQPPALA